MLKTSRYHLEHSFGHGKQNLAALLVSLNLLAFAFHTVCDKAEELWRRARSKAGSRAQFFGNLAAITTFLIFPSWEDLLQTLAFAKPPPRRPQPLTAQTDRTNLHNPTKSLTVPMQMPK